MGKVGANMISLRTLSLCACAALIGISLSSSPIEAGERFGGGFFMTPFWGPQYQPPSWRQRYHAPRNQIRRKDYRADRKLATSRNKRQAALAIPRKAAPPRVVQQPIGCDRAQEIVAEYGFKDIKAEMCGGETLGFSATRDGKPFSIQIVAANGEFAQVRRLR